MNPEGMPDPTTQYAQLKSAVLGAQQAGGASPLGNFPELNKLYSDTYPLEAKSQAVAGSAYNAQVQDSNAKAAAAQKIKEEQDMLDSSKYQRVPLSDGGYKFLAPNGQEISASNYAHIVGTDEASVLKGSQNPIDVGFINDFSNLQKALTAISNKDETTYDAIDAASGYQLGQYKNDLPGLINRFKQAYPTVYGGNQNGNQPVNSSLVGYVNSGG